jgi:diaminopimelate decarboxylase
MPPPRYLDARMLQRNARGTATLGGLAVDDALRAAAVRTPAYVYDVDAMVETARALRAGFGSAPHLVAYAIKANSAGPILRAFAEAGVGAEAVSGSEVEVAIACGVRPDRILYSGVGKTDSEIDRAISVGESGILSVQIESVEEIGRIEARASALGRTARVSLRVNPDVTADTHAHVATGHDEAKFGVAREDLGAAWDALAQAKRLRLVGVSSHIGSQLTRTDEYLAAADVLLALAAERERVGSRIELLDFGGGFGVDYGAGCATAPADFARAIALRVAQSPLAGRTIVLEPGRSLVAAHGVLCASVVLAKRSRGGRQWLVVDAGMNDLLRPALYGALHRIEPVGSPPPDASTDAPTWRVAGPVCESSDDFGTHRLPDPPPEQVVFRDAGAYGFVMASEYNGRALPAEVFIRDGRVVAVHRPRSAAEWAAERARIGQVADRRGRS